MQKLYQSSFCINFYENLLNNNSVKDSFALAKNFALNEISKYQNLNNQKNKDNSYEMLNGQPPTLIAHGEDKPANFKEGKVANINSERFKQFHLPNEPFLNSRKTLLFQVIKEIVDSVDKMTCIVIYGERYAGKTRFCQRIQWVFAVKFPSLFPNGIFIIELKELNN